MAAVARSEAKVRSVTVGGYAAYKDIEAMNLKDRLDEALKRIERLSLALTRIECECSGEYAAQIAHAALYGQN